MKVIDHINRAKDVLFSFEILPPLKGKSIHSIYRILDKLAVFNPPFINVTYHRAEYKFKQLPNGLFEKVYIRKRPGTVGICAAIRYKYKVDTVPHIVCGGFNRMETEDALMDLNYLGIDNVLLLRGDPVKSERNFVPNENGNKNATELVKQTVNLNNGIYLEDEIKNPLKTDFCIGVAGYPEKHFEAPNLQIDMAYLKEKVDAGADYIVTQMFFDNEKYYEFVNNCREVGIKVPIIPGLKPITSKKQLYTIPGIFHVALPDKLASAVLACKDDDEVKKVGIQWAIEQCKGLIDFGTPCLHFYTIRSVNSVVEICKALRS